MNLICQNCRKKYPDAKADGLVPLDQVSGLKKRLTPGDTVPYGECGTCGALVHDEAGYRFHYVYSISDVANDQARKWLEHQDDLCGALKKKPPGVAPAWIFIPTRLGLITKVRHSPSGNELDLTDYNAW